MSTAPKEKRRNSEKRKEKSRNAARCRREKETELFYELGHMLPMPHSMCITLDKAGIMRLVLCHLKIHKLLSVDNTTKVKVDKDTEVSENDQKLIDRDKLVETLYPKALEGFLLVLSKDGDIAYLSENVSKYLGLTQIDLLGQSIYDYSHPCDHEEIREQLSDRPGLNYISSKPEREHHSFLVRMKCTVTPKGKNVNLKSATYKVVQCTGHIRLSLSEATSVGQLRPPVPCMVMLVLPIPHPANIETPLDTKTFMTRHSMDMKFTDCDDRIQDLIGYAPEDLVGKSFYDFHHALDGSQIERCHRNLFAKGQTTTGHYRFLAKEGGYVWLETQATVIYHNKTNKAECVVCVNYVLSGLENGDVPISLNQYRRSNPSEVQRSTEKIFAPKIGGKSSDFPNWITSNEEQESEEELLKYLAPTAGDVMIPLTVDICKKDSQKLTETEGSDSETCVPFNPFATMAEAAKKNMALLAADQVLSGQPGTVVDIPSKELDLVDNNSPLNSSHDPLLTTDTPPNRHNANINKQKFEEMLSNEDLLCMYAPYIPMGEDLDLSVDLEDDDLNLNPEVNSTWKPVDPFSYNMEKDGFANYNPVLSQENNMPFPTSTFLGQPRSPPSLLSPSLAPSQPSSPRSSFGGSLPNLCAISSALPFSPLRSPVELDNMDMPGTSKSMVPLLQTPDSNGGMMVSIPGQGQNISDMIYTNPTTSAYQTAAMPPSCVTMPLTSMVDNRPYYTAVNGHGACISVPSSLKRRLNIPDTGQAFSRTLNMSTLKQEPELLPIGEPPEKVYCRNGNGIQQLNIPPVSLGIGFSHSNLLQQVARKINNRPDPYQSSNILASRALPKTAGYPDCPSRSNDLSFNNAVDCTLQPTQTSSAQMDDLCRILNLTT